MRLLNINSLKFTEFSDESRPPYITASHRWLSNDEATYQDVRDGNNTTSKGYLKVLAFASYIRENLPTIKWLWIDTCCINKDSAAELSEAINSMFEWYHGAELCLAYLADVQDEDASCSLEKSEWFKRGWTLQELLAPRTVLFVTNEWHVIGYKGDAANGSHQCGSMSVSLDKTIAQITSIPEHVLRDYETGRDVNVYDKMRWIEGRKTTKPEDMSYALFGLVGVILPAIYGEKNEGARQRLLAAIHQRDNAATQQAKHLRKIGDWLLSTDPWTDHETIRQRHEPHTGAWLLHQTQYLAWTSGALRAVWVYGKAGCGKTVLCSTAIEDIRTRFQHTPNTGQAIFYFSFSDNRKQTFQNLVRSLVIQLCWREPGLSLLVKAYEDVRQKQPMLDELQNILLSCIRAYDQVFLHLDGIDECPDRNGIRQNVLDGISGIFEQAPNVHMLVTSRDVPDVRCFMHELSAGLLPIAAKTVDADIQRYVSAQISRDRKLSRLSNATKSLIETTLARKANGMFRWVYCQIIELTKSKNTRPKAIEGALFALPKDLDETYERMLNTINGDDHPHALRLLRWLAYTEVPITLAELAEASIIELDEDMATDDFVDEDNRPDWEDPLHILAGLVIRVGADGKDKPQREPAKKGDNVTLAHFSVKEYLESSRIRASVAKTFFLDPAREHRFLAQSCLVYLSHYSNSSRKFSNRKDYTAFPLLKYTGNAWSYHALLQRHGSTKREVSLFTSEVRLRDWLLLRAGDALSIGNLGGPFKAREELERLRGGLGSPLYYASILGLETVTKDILNAGGEVNQPGGWLGSALAAASYGGYKKIVHVLLNAGARVDAVGEVGTALQAASREGHKDVMELLMRANADPNAGGGEYDTALQSAAAENDDLTVQLLIEEGADLEASTKRYGNALRAAVIHGHERNVRILIDAGADIHAQPFGRQSALSLAENTEGEMEQVILEAEAEYKEHQEGFDSASQAALVEDHEPQRS